MTAAGGKVIVAEWHCTISRVLLLSIISPGAWSKRAGGREGLLIDVHGSLFA